MTVNPQRSDSQSKPRIRWWLPGTAVNPSILTAQLESVLLAGFGGVEVAFLGMGGGKGGLKREDKWGVDGGEKTREVIKHIWKECGRLDLHADLTIGPAFPAMVPGLSGDSQGAAKELVHGQSEIISSSSTSSDVETFDIPTPEYKPAGRTPANLEYEPALELLSIHAVRIGENPILSKDGKPSRTLELLIEDEVRGYQGSVLDLMTSMKGDQIHWKVPKEGIWRIVASYARGSAQTKSAFEQNDLTYTDPISHVVDHFSKEGVNRLREFYETHIVTPEIQQLFKERGSSLFEDSLELSQTQYYTPGFLSAFAERRGYDLTPYLPLVHDYSKLHFFSPIESAFKLQVGGSERKRGLQERVRFDFALTVSDLFMIRLEHLKEWANSIDLRIRNQPYGVDFDAALAATKVDIVEGETLCFWGNHDSYRILATGRDVAGAKILSEELAAVMHHDYDMSWKEIISRANQDFALGVNQIMMHGIPYDYSDNSEWPGFMPFAPGPLPGFADAWGPRQPQWQFSSPYTSYLATCQSILQHGKARVDVGIYHSPVEGVKGGMKDPALNVAGYSYGFPSDGLLEREDAVVTDGKLWANGPGYKCLILDNVTSMTLATAKLILKLAETDLPIVIVGEAPSTTAGIEANLTIVEADKALGRIFGATLKGRKARQVNTMAEVPAVLEGLNVRPSITYSNPNKAMNAAVREGEGITYYYLFNPDDSTIEQTVTLPLTGTICEVNLWDGGRETECESSKSEVMVNLPGKGAKVYCVRKSGAAGQNTEPSVTNQLMELAVLESWNLEVEDWQPEDEKAIGRGSEKTKKKQTTYNLASLTSWQDIQGLEDVSGTATYSTTFKLPIRPVSPTIIALRHLEDAFKVILNGQVVDGIDRIANTTGDIALLLKTGDNTLQILIGTTLNNRMRVLHPETYAKRESTKHGLLGPVKLLTTPK